ncbi:hypothetical protein [Aliamphritea spongicola]|nr:hypothetical protein [Aliamphritea spongicola]
MANETPEPLLVSAELNAVAECDYSDVLAQVAAEGRILLSRVICKVKMRR